MVLFGGSRVALYVAVGRFDLWGWERSLVLLPGRTKKRRQVWRASDRCGMRNEVWAAGGGRDVVILRSRRCMRVRSADFICFDDGAVA